MTSFITATTALLVFPLSSSLRTPVYFPLPVCSVCYTWPGKVRVAHSLRDSGVFITHPKLDKRSSLFSCGQSMFKPVVSVLSCSVTMLEAGREKLQTWISPWPQKIMLSPRLVNLS